MKKIYSFLLSLSAAFALTSTVNAQSVTSVDELSNDAVYTIKSGRGYLVYNEAKPDEGWCSENSNSPVTVTEDAPEVYAQWVFYTLEDGSRFLYNLGNSKFLQASGGKTAFVETPTIGNVTFIASTGGAKDTYPVVVAFGANQINMSKDQSTAAFTNWNDTGDEGNMAAVFKVADLSADVKAAIAERLTSFVPLDPQRNLVTFDNNKVYTFASKRGAWKYDASVSTENLVAESKATEAANGYFAVLTSENGNTYVYSIGASKFLGSSGIETALSETPQNTISLIENYGNNEEYPYIVSNNGNYIGISTSYPHGFYVGWNYVTDEGNQTLIKEVEGEEFNPEAALALIATYEAELEKAQKVNLITPANNKVYTITTATRGGWAYDAAYTYSSTNEETQETTSFSGAECLVSSNVAGISENLPEENKQFAILTSEAGHTYIYNVAAKKFVGIFGEGGEDSQSGASLTDIPTTKETVLIENYKNSTAYPYLIAVGERQIAISNQYVALGGIISFWNDATDEGNQYLIKEVEGVEFDATEALATIKSYETATGIHSATNENAKANAIYDLTGRKIVGKPSKGIYVIDGKKTIVK